MDTVFDPGTAAERPFAIDADGIARGPGVTDMKSGLLAGLYAVKALVAAGPLPFERLTYVANPDEEIGSPTSTPHIREIAAESDVCLVLECARANGDIVSSRKGILDARVRVDGRAAHAGVEPEKGRSAILAAADLVTRLHALNGRWDGVTINVGVIEGGTRPNVVAERCSFEVDVRAVRRADLEAAEAEIRAMLGVARRAGRDRRAGADGPLVADGEARAVGPARRARPGGRPAARLRGPRRGDRRCVGREHDVGHGRRLDRRARPDRRHGSLARGVPRGRLDRAANRAARRSAAGDRAGSGRRGVAGGRPGSSAGRDAARRLVSSGGPYEARYGYSRAVVVGDSCWVAGTTDAGPDGRSRHPDDAAGQARAAWAIAIGALDEAGFAVTDVVRTRMYIVRPEDATAVAAVNGELFGTIRPAATLVRVAGLIDPSMLVEVELEARRG